MAFVINKDGTVSSTELKTDSYGIIKPVGSYDPQDLSHITNTATNSSTYSPTRKKKTIRVNPIPPIINTNTHKVSKHSPKKQSFIVDLKYPIKTRISINEFFIDKRNHRHKVSNEELHRAKKELKGSLLKYFLQQYRTLYHDMHWEQEPTTSTKGKNKKVNSQKKDHKNYIADNDSSTESPRAGGKPPKYGYARDFFGRVQERDILNEDRKHEFKQSQKKQSNYDYSNYDSEDDHDSYYDSGSYK